MAEYKDVYFWDYAGVVFIEGLNKRKENTNVYKPIYRLVVKRVTETQWSNKISMSDSPIILRHTSKKLDETEVGGKETDEILRHQELQEWLAIVAEGKRRGQGFPVCSSQSVFE